MLGARLDGSKDGNCSLPPTSPRSGEGYVEDTVRVAVQARGVWSAVESQLARTAISSCSVGGSLHQAGCALEGSWNVSSFLLIIFGHTLASC